MKKPIAALAALFLAGGAVLGFAGVAQATTVTCIPSDGIAAYDETVIDTAAYDEVVVDSEAHWQRYSAKGSWKEDYAPAFPGDIWQANVQGDPHGIGVAGAYSVSNENSGNVDWFYLEWVPETSHLVHHDEVSHIVHHDAVDPVICDPEVVTVVPTVPTAKDLCATDNDHYGIPYNTADITYSRSGLDILATIITDASWGALPAGYVDNGDGTATYPFSATDWTNVACDAPDTDFNLLAWLAPGGLPPHHFDVDQTLLTHQWQEDPNLDGLDGWLSDYEGQLECEVVVVIQVDLEIDDATTDSLIAGAVLHGPNDPTEHHAFGWVDGNPWKFVTLTGPECAPDPQDPTVTTREVSTEDVNCDSKIVTTTTEHFSTTTTYVYNPETKEFDAIVGEEVQGEDTTETRAATDVDCPPVVKELPVTLAYTGTDEFSTNVLLLSGGMALLIGGTIFVSAKIAARRKATN